MKNICRFSDCKKWGKMCAVYVKTQDPKMEVYELVWCSECGRVQNQFR